MAQSILSLLSLISAAIFLNYVSAECPNACSAHGRCGAYDACYCYRNWMSNDCSERICQFGLAHVDVPKGDLDSSGGSLYGPKDHTLTQWDVVSGSDLYPYGTNEQFPNVVDSDYNVYNGALTVIKNSAHYYAECSSKGICDRATGTCTCVEGYEGSSCQRASCPSSGGGVCSGHGTCQTIEEISYLDNQNIYSLWDKEATMGCVCDSGYSGPDCSQRKCKFGYDPLYYDDQANVRYSNWTFALYNVVPKAQALTDVGMLEWEGNYSITFYDAHGEDWETAPIGISETCDSIIAKIEALPNDVIKGDSVLCSFDKLNYRDGSKSEASVTYDPDFNVFAGVDGFPIYFPQSGNGNTQLGALFEEHLSMVTKRVQVRAKFTLAFPANPGKLKQPKINYYLDGTRPTLTTGQDATTLGNWVFPNGFSGENDDFVPDLCEGITVTIKPSGYAGTEYFNSGVSGKYFATIEGLDVQGLKQLKRCLGGSDKKDDNNVDVYNWDFGNLDNPHLIKLVDATVDPVSRLCDNKKGYISGSNHQVLTTPVGTGYCLRNNPPGFYAVVVASVVNAGVTPKVFSKFKVLNRFSQDFDSSTKFYVYTTTGILQRVNKNVAAFTTSHATALATEKDVATWYQPFLYTTNISSWSDNTPDLIDPVSPEYVTFFGGLDCETSTLPTSDMVSGTPGSFLGGGHDCLEKGDYLIALAAPTAASDPLLVDAEGLNLHEYIANPKYINIYQVQKIGRDNREFWDHPDSEKKRHRITLDMGLNARFLRGIDDSTPVVGDYPLLDTPATIYKFYPPGKLLNDKQPTTYAGECSTRGICDTATGLCTCFAGYTGDDCGSMNALAA